MSPTGSFKSHTHTHGGLETMRWKRYTQATSNAPTADWKLRDAEGSPYRSHRHLDSSHLCPELFTELSLYKLD
jgi:hypothetical protein